MNGVEDQHAKAGSGEDNLDKDRDTDQAAKGNAEHSDGWDDGITQRVLVGHTTVAKPIRAGSSNVIRIEHLEHARTNKARDVTDPGDGEGGDRQDQVKEVVDGIRDVARTDRRQGVQAHRKDHKQQETRNVGRDRDHGDTEDSSNAVEQ